MLFRGGQPPGRVGVVGLQPISNTYHLFTQTKVSEHHMTVLVQQYILQLHVAVNDAQLVQKLQCQRYLAQVKFGLVLLHPLNTREV